MGRDPGDLGWYKRGQAWLTQAKEGLVASAPCPRLALARRPVHFSGGPVTEPIGARPGSSGRVGWILPVLLLALAIGLSFGRALALGRDQLSGLYDAFKYFGPIAYYMDCALHAGGLPLWNPLTYCGLPFAANPQASLFYPPHLLRGLLNVDPTPFGTQVSMVVAMGLHMLVAGAGTFRLARSHGLAWGASMASALAFTLSAAMVRRVSEYHYVYTLAWLPWILLAVRHCLAAEAWRPRLRAVVSIGVMAGVAFLGGFLHIIVYMGVAIGVYWVAQRLLVSRLSTPEPGRRSATITFDAASLALAGLFAAGIAAVGLLPAAELIGFTARASDQAVTLYVDIGSYSARDWVESLVVFPGLKAAGSGIRGSGLLALILAFAALLHRDRRAVASLLITYYALLDCSIGPPMPVASAMQALTPFANSAHARAYDVALLPLCLLVGFGVDALARAAPDSHGLARVGRGLIVALGIALLYCLWQWTSPHRFLRVGPWVVLVPAVGLLMIALAPRVATGPRRLPVARALALLVFLEMLVWNVQYTDRLIRKRHPEPAGRHAGRASMPLDNVRGVDVNPNRSLFELRQVINGYDPLNIHRVQQVIDGWDRENEYHRTVVSLEPTSLNRRGHLFLKRPFWLARAWSPGPLPGRRESFESATTVFLDEISIPAEALPVPPRRREEVIGHALSADVESVSIKPTKSFFDAVAERRKLQRIAILEMGRREEAGGDAGARHTVVFADYDTTQAVVEVRPRFTDMDTGRVEFGVHSVLRAGRGQLEIPCPDMRRAKLNFEIEPGGGEGRFVFTALRAAADLGDEDPLISILERSANRVDVEVGPLDDWRILMHVDAHYPGWWAEVDGERAEILLANDAFKAILVPPGTHHVRFQFDPPRVWVGATISLMTLVLASILAQRAGRRHA